MRWNPGDQIVLRYRGDWSGDFTTWVMPVTVVQDTPDCIALYLAAGTPIKIPARADGSEVARNLPFEERANAVAGLRDGVWHSNERLMLARSGAAHLVSLFWAAESWAFLDWYVDLQAPFERTPLGFDSQDQVLDIVVAPDLTWRWKDEDEFADARRIGRFTPEEAAAVRTEGERVIETIESRGWPFDENWPAWRPDPSWQIPGIPNGWDRF